MCTSLTLHTDVSHEMGSCEIIMRRRYRTCKSLARTFMVTSVNTLYVDHIMEATI